VAVAKTGRGTGCPCDRRRPYGSSYPLAGYLGEPSRKVNLSHVFAGQSLGVTQVGERIWLVTFMQYDVMGARLRFVARLIEDEKMAPLCAEFGIWRRGRRQWPWTAGGYPSSGRRRGTCNAAWRHSRCVGRCSSRGPRASRRSESGDS